MGKALENYATQNITRSGLDYTSCEKIELSSARDSCGTVESPNAVGFFFRSGLLTEPASLLRGSPRSWGRALGRP